MWSYWKIKGRNIVILENREQKYGHTGKKEQKYGHTGN